MKLLSTIITFFALVFTTHVAGAGAPDLDPVNQKARSLLSRLKGKIEIQATPLMRFYLSPTEPSQGQSVDLFVEAKVSFSGRTASIDAKLDGKEVAFRKPATHLWVLPLGVVTEAKSHTLNVKKYMENAQDNLELRDAIKALDNNINSLTNQINAEREAGRRKLLQAQRAEKVALKNELIEQLKKLRTKVGEEVFTFKVKPGQNVPGFPSVQSLSPTFGPITGGTEIIVSGSNFTSDFSANFNGVAASDAEFISATELKVTTPSFQAATSSVGAKNLELRFSTPQGIKNVMVENAFYATEEGATPPTYPLKPVAVATSGQEILLGQTSVLDGTQSYDPNGDAIAFEWKVLNSPAGSNYSPGSIIGTSANSAITPNKAGTFVFQLRVREQTLQELESDPSTVVIIVKGPPVPTVANLNIGSGKLGSVQVVANNANPNEAATYEIISSPAYGNASISTGGLVSYTSNRNYVGLDEYRVRVTNLSGLSGEVTGSINVISSNLPPQPQAAAIQVTANQLAFTQVLGNDPNTDQTLSYSILTQGALGNAFVNAAGSLSYQAAGAVGNDVVVVRVTDDGNPVLSADFSVSIYVLEQNLPPAPTADSFNLAFGDSGNVQIVPNDPNLNQTHTYTLVSPTNLGTATVSPTGQVNFTAGNQAGSGALVVLVTDSGSNPLSSTISIPVQVFDPQGGPVIGNLGFALFNNGTPAEVVLFVDDVVTTPTGTITNLRWNFGDGTSERTFDPTANISHNYIAYGSYTATLTATNSLGISTSKSFTFNLVNSDIPTARMTANVFAGASPLTVNFDATASSDSDGIVAYRWNWGTNYAAVGDEITTTPTNSHTFTEPGVYGVRLLTVDPFGAVGYSFITIFVDETPPLPIYPAIADLYLQAPGRRIILGNAATFDGSRSFNPNIGSTVDQYWFESSEPGCDEECSQISASPIYVRTFEQIGNYYPSLRVAGPDGEFFFEYGFEVNVVNSGHAPRAVPYADVTWGEAPLTVNFTNESYDYDGTVDSINWYFDPSSSNCGENCAVGAPSTTFTFVNPGVEFVTLGATDNDQNEHYNFLLIDVQEPGKKKKKTKLNLPPPDPARAEKRRRLTHLCAKNDGPACFGLSAMYVEDGNSELAEKLKARSCALGHLPACAAKLKGARK